MSIPFNRPFLTGRESEYLSQALEKRGLSGNGEFTKRCESLLEQMTKAHKALLVHSCTAALEMCGLLLDLKPGDEVIMPSFTFVTTASAVALRGAVPVFVDIRSDTLNIDENKIEAAITPKTKAIIVVHYAGIACEMDTIIDIAKKYRISVVEDSAQGTSAYYKGRALGTIGDLGAVSFHETKNVVSGEGGALFVNNKTFDLRAEILREKGTNRTSFLRKEVAFYTWVDLGSSYVISDLLAAVLLAQLEKAESITNQRLKVWNHYHRGFENAEKKGDLQRPFVPQECKHNGHIYFLVLSGHEQREKMINDLKKEGIGSVFHYLPLHSSPAGKKYGRAHGDLKNTDRISESMLRLPVWPELDEVERVTETVLKYL
jgi:dTDP-4-amino-4,6-dideoxygalactose transaminase